MRYISIIIATIFGMILSWIILLNPQIVHIRLDSVDANGLSWLEEPVRAMALWKVICWSVGFGAAMGALMVWGNGADNRRRLRDYDQNTIAEAVDNDDPDYVFGLHNRRR